MEPSEKDIQLLESHNKQIRMRVRLLNSDTYEEESEENITGNIISSSFNRSYDSDIRNTCTLTLAVANKNKLNIDFDRVWNKRMVELFCGLYDANTNTFVEYSLGRMLMDRGHISYTATSQEVQLTLVDLMASLTAERGSQVGTDVYIPSTEQGVNIRTLLINILGQFGTFKRYDICNFEETLPHDLNFNIGIYPIEMFQRVLELFPYYEMFYDNKGIFTVQKIPTKIGDPIDVGRDIIDEMLISESKDSNFSDIKNTTEIWGKELECDYVSVGCVTVNNCYNVTIASSFTTYVDGESYAVYVDTDSVSGQKMNIQDIGAYNLYVMNGDGTYRSIYAEEMLANNAYAIRYYQSKFILEGELQVRCIVQEITEPPSDNAKAYYKEQNNCNNVEWVINPDSPYACTISPTTGRIIGEIKQVLNDGEYADIYTTQLAFERARYENWKKCRLTDTTTIELILIPWMEINDKIQYTSPITGEIVTRIVQGIDYNFTNWTMTVQASRFYPYYPWDNGEEED